ncbi:hypothetical protein DH2020_046007 [Rehmannia glutinosa]|uniref:Uncharacterized protein n=1 Tax=Rehmannia glutinosa TaxID=99300 RepID=A0ABR0UDD0_REHGL
MEGGKQSGSSFASDLFGAKDSSTTGSPSGVFGSIFAPPAKVSNTVVVMVVRFWDGNRCIKSETEKKNNPGNPAWSGKTGVSDSNAVGGEGQNQGTASKDASSYYQDQKVETFHYSSSIYYGGQDVYSRPQNAQNPVFSTFNKDGGEDESGTASRGNWWQGKLLSL